MLQKLIIILVLVSAAH